MHHWKPAAKYLESAVAALQRGQLVGMPTETVYGLAGNALDARAVAEIFAAKGRPTFDPLIVHAAHSAAALALAEKVPDHAARLAEAFWPGPLTLVLPRKSHLPELLSAGLDTVALRVPSHAIARELLSRCGFPLAAPSANRFGQISPTRAEHVLEELAGQSAVAGVLDAGPCQVGVESTVVAFPGGGRVRVLRNGGIPIEELSEVVGEVEWVDVRHAVDDPALTVRGEQSPGMLARHYAPRTPLDLLETAPVPEDPRLQDPRFGWLVFSETLPATGPVLQLSPAGDLREAAAGLFVSLRTLDALGLRRILALRLPEHGLGRAINDRLSRAAHPESV